MRVTLPLVEVRVMVGAVTLPARASEIEASDLTVTEMLPSSLLASRTDEPAVVASKVMFLDVRSLPLVRTIPVSMAVNSREFSTLPPAAKSIEAVVFLALLETLALPAGVLTLVLAALVLPMVTSPVLEIAVNAAVESSLAPVETPVLPVRLRAVAAV